MQMALVTFKSLDGNPIEDVSNTLFRQWGVGKKGKDEGIMLLLAVQDHRDRIEVGYGLEPILPDGFDGSILRGIAPLLKQGAYGQAMISGAAQMSCRHRPRQGRRSRTRRPHVRDRTVTTRSAAFRCRSSLSASSCCFCCFAAGQRRRSLDRPDSR